MSAIAYKIAEALGDQGLKKALDTPKAEPAVEFIEAAGTTIAAEDEGWRKLTGDSKRDLNPMTQMRMQKLALYLWESNLLANRLVELPVAFMLSQGVKVVASDEEVQEWIDRFWKDPINQMDIKLITKARQLSLLGEQCYPAFVNEVNGHVRLGYLDPDQIATIVKDPDNSEQPIGVVTVKDKHGKARRYKIIVNGPEDIFTKRTQLIRESFDDGECFYFNVNAISNGSRGRSDLLAQIDWLDSYDQFLFGEIDRSQFMRAFIWDVELANATPDEVNARAKQIESPSPASTRVHNDSEKWNAVSPTLGSADTEKTAKLFRNHVLGGASLPEHWYGGAGDVNRAVGAEMGEPTFKIFEMRQTFIGYMLETILTFQIRMRATKALNEEPDLFDDLFSFEIQWPEMISKDTTKYASSLQQVTVAVIMLIDNKIITKDRGMQIVEKISAKLGVEFDVAEEMKAAEELYKEELDKDVFTAGSDDE